MKLKLGNILFRNRRYSLIAGRIFTDFGEGNICQKVFYSRMKTLHGIMSKSGKGLLDDKNEFDTSLEFIGNVVKEGRCIGMPLGLRGA